MEIQNEQKNMLYKIGMVFLVVLTIHLAVKTFGGFSPRHYWGNNQTPNVITVSGHGEVTAVPDIANVYFTIRKESKTAKDAQTAVALIEKKAIDALKADGVSEKDFKTSNASFNPKYEYKYETNTVMPCTEYGCPPRPGKSVITGYEASESIVVKVRDTDNVGKIMQDLGTIGVSDLSGPNFAIDDEDGLKAQARKEAIEEAKAKAKVLAKDLGVRLGGVTSFNESGNYPMYYAKDMMMSAGSVATPAPAQIPKGENTVTSDVTITYEIR